MLRASLLLFAFVSLCSAQKVVSLGDSIGAGVQSADVSIATQVGVYSKLVANQAHAPHPLPLIVSSPVGVVYSLLGRFRLNPATPPLNLAYSGADVASALTERPSLPIDSEIDLILTPYSGSQIEIAELIGPDLALCWLGSNDALSAVLSFDQLDASQLTPVAEFETKFREIAQRLAASSERVVFVNIPRVSNIAYAMNPAELEAYAGSDFGLPAGHLTTLITATALRTGLVGPGLLSDPNFVLDPTEIAAIQQRVDAFNAVIAAEAAAVNAPVFDAAALFDDIDQNGYQLFGFTLTSDFLGGVFSLDGVHPSNTAHAVIANEIIKLVNSFYGSAIPEISQLQLWLTLFFDPHVDKDGDGRVTGRPRAGLLEALAPALGFSGDPDDLTPDPPFTVNAAQGRAFITQAEGLAGIRPQSKPIDERALDAAAAAIALRR